MLKEFQAFIMRGNVLDLAVGVIIGGAFQKIIDALVEHLFMPLIGALLGGVDFAKESIQIGGVSLGWGLVFQATLNFVAVAFVLFLILKAYNKAAKAKVEYVAPSPTEVLLADIKKAMDSIDAKTK